MFSYVFMKILETRPRSYDRNINRASLGKIRAIKRQIANQATPGSKVLEIGCGTGELAGMLVAAGCNVEGFDLSPSMVGAARERIKSEGLGDSFTVHNAGVDSMDIFADRSYDTVVSTLVFSEMSDDERRYALANAYRVLSPGGKIIIADEVSPRSGVLRFLHSMTRAPALLGTYLVTSATTRPLDDIAGELTAAGFVVGKYARSQGDSFAVVVAVKPAGDKNDEPA